MGTIQIDNTSWNIEQVKAYSKVSEFKKDFLVYDWFTPEYLTQVFDIIKALK